MAVILGWLFLGVSVLAHHLMPCPTHEETVLSQVSRVVIGGGRGRGRGRGRCSLS